MVSAFSIIDIATFAVQVDFANFPTFCAVGGKDEGVHDNVRRSEFTSLVVISCSLLDHRYKASWYDIVQRDELVIWFLFTATNPDKMKFVKTM